MRSSRLIAPLALLVGLFYACGDDDMDADAGVVPASDASTDIAASDAAGGADVRGTDVGPGVDAAVPDAGSPDGARPDVPPGSTVDTPFAAFPEAEGFGAVAIGGRGGRVIQVTNLNDSGPGSFREACEASGPRTVVFRVGGTITLESNVEVREPFLTIAGQTAPGEGIMLRGNGARNLSMLRIFTHDVIVRHLRFRRGPSTNGGECNADAIAFLGADRVIVDHVSASWTTDQLMTLWPGTNVTIQESILSEALFNSTHSDDCTADGPLEPHALGPIVGNSSADVTFYRNLFANNVGRNPQISPTAGGFAEVINNVIYNACYAVSISGQGDDNVEANAIGNFIKWGPNSCEGHRNNILMGGSTRAYLEDNLTPARNEGDDEWLASSQFLSRTPALEEFQSTERFETPTSRIASAADTYSDVPDSAGAQLVAQENGDFRVFRDSVDLRTIEDVRSGTDRVGTTGRRLDHPNDVGGWPDVASGTPYVDADADGMPDVWEAVYGLDSGDAEDRNDDTDEDGYTNLEEYLNGTHPG